MFRWPAVLLILLLALATCPPNQATYFPRISSDIAAQPAQASLITNGSFELSCVDPGGNLVTLPGGDVSIAGWAVLPSGIDYIGGFWQAAGGSRSLDLDGSPGTSGGIQQTFATVPGAQYTVSFDLAGNPVTGPTLKSLRVIADGQSAVFTFDVTGRSRMAMGWTRTTWSFTADNLSATLQFMSLTGTGSGPALDNVSVSGQPVQTQPVCTPPPAGLVSWWRAEGNANDTKGRNPGLLMNGATFAPGWVGQAFNFDGVNDTVLVPHSDDLNFAPGSALTLEAWAFRTGCASVQHLLGKRAGCGGDFNWYQMAFDSRFNVFPSIPLNEWAHIAVVYEQATGLTRHYLNGALVSAVQFRNGANTSPLIIGGSGTCQPFGGLLDEVAIYNRALTEAEIQAIHKAGRAGKCSATTVSAASFRERPLAPDSIVASFGSNLATELRSAPPGASLPTTLGGTTIRVTDSAGIERAGIFFVSSMQANFHIPAGTASGPVGVTITNGQDASSYSLLQIEAVAPGLFSANADGQGVAAAVVLRIKADGAQTFEPVAQFDSSQGKFFALPIDLGPETEQVFLILFGTGIRHRSALAAVTTLLGGTNAEVLFAGPQGGFVGLDQINLRLPRSLTGRGHLDVVLTADAKTANTVHVNIK